MPDWQLSDHFERDIPGGYLETLESGTNVIQDKELALYYSKLHYVIRGPLFDAHRLIEIWKFNIGSYDYLLSHYPQGEQGNKAPGDGVPQRDLNNAIPYYP